MRAGLIACLAPASACAIKTGLPFPSSFTMTDPDHFQFVAHGTWDFPANTARGEQARLDGLDAYLAGQHTCSAGYEITHREKEHVVMSPKHNVEDQQLLSITYLGRCKAQGNGNG